MSTMDAVVIGGGFYGCDTPPPEGKGFSFMPPCGGAAGPSNMRRVRPNYGEARERAPADT
jgi:hypothetical protein